MSNWKDYPHLFANGKFLCALPHFINLRIEMYDTLANMYCLSDVKGWHKISDCTLIARKIDSLSDKEIKGYFNSYKPNYWDEMESCGWSAKSVREGLDIYGMSSNQLVYLLSIGVYPFSQEDFENGTVIDINTL